MKRKALDIRRRDLRQLLDEIADRGRLVVTERRRTTVQTMFRWALRQDIVEIDPSAELSPYGQATPRERVLTGDEVRALWEWLNPGMPATIADILKVQLCLGARVGEVAGMMAPEFERDASERLLWLLPAGRSKNGRERLTPILGLALGILEPRLKAARAGDGRLFVPRVREKPERHQRRHGDHQTPRGNADRGMGFPRPTPNRRLRDGQARTAVRDDRDRARPNGGRSRDRHLDPALHPRGVH